MPGTPGTGSRRSPAPLTASFAYDGFGRWATKTLNDVTTVFRYDGLDVVRESSGGSDVAYLRSLAIDEALVRTDPTASTFLLADALGSTVALTDAAGATATEYTYEPFGNTAVTGTPSAGTFQYTGRENDGIGLYYYRARYYDPTRSRFVSEDPIGFDGGINFYAYVGNDPISLVDPTGNGPCLNVEAFVKWMNDHARGKTKTQRKCAPAVRMGLQAGGLDTRGNPEPAKDYGPFLLRLGFVKVSQDSPLQIGDIMVFQPGPSASGHIQVWNGNQWVSDYMQPMNTGVYPGTYYQAAKAPHALYRTPQPCP